MFNMSAYKNLYIIFRRYELKFQIPKALTNIVKYIFVSNT